MKKRGILAFIIYLVGTIFAAFLAIYANVEAQKIPEDGGGWAGLGAALLLIFAMVIGIPFAAELIVKILHMATGLKLFGIICILGDLAILAYLIVGLFASSPTPEVFLRELPAITIFALPSTLAFISNLRSVKD